MNSLEAALQFALASQLQASSCGPAELWACMRPAWEAWERHTALALLAQAAADSCLGLRARVCPPPSRPPACPGRVCPPTVLLSTHGSPAPTHSSIHPGRGGGGQQRAGAGPARGSGRVPPPRPVPLHLGRRQQRLLLLHGAARGGRGCAGRLSPGGRRRGRGGAGRRGGWLRGADGWVLLRTGNRCTDGCTAHPRCPADAIIMDDVEKMAKATKKQVGGGGGGRHC